MSVYTPVTASDLDAWLTRYTVGGLAALEPIASGIENTNYFVTTDRGRYVLTLYERLPAGELRKIERLDLDPADFEQVVAGTVLGLLGAVLDPD